MSRPWVKGVLLALLFGSGPGFAKDDEPGKPAPPAAPPAAAPARDDSLAYAAADTWPMQDGCPARTRATRTRPVVGPTEVAWTFHAPGRIVGQPLVGGDWLLVHSVTESPREDCLDVLRLADGKPVIEPRRWPSVFAVDPVLWQDYVLIAVGPSTYEAMRIDVDARALEPGWTFFATEAPLLLGSGEMIVRNGGDVQRWRIGQDEPLWSKKTEHWDAKCPLSARDGWVYGLQKHVEGHLTLERIAIADGAESTLATFGWRGRIPTVPNLGNSISVGTKEIYVQLEEGFPVEGSKDGAGCVRIEVNSGGIVAEPFVDDATSLPVMWGDATILSTLVRKEGMFLVKSPVAGPAPAPDPAAAPGSKSWHFDVLAGGKAKHREWLPPSAPRVVASGVAIGPSGAFDLETNRILYASPDRGTGAVVPARETLLAVEGADTLVARRSERAPRRGAGVSIAARAGAKPLSIPGGILVAIDGSVRAGSFTVPPKGGSVEVAGRSPLDLDEVGLLLDATDHILHGPDSRFVSREPFRAAQRKSLPEFVALARSAIETRSPAAAARAIREAAERGAPHEGVLGPLLKELTLLEHPKSADPAPPLDAAKIEALERRREGLLASERATLWNAFASLPDSVPVAYRADVLRAVLHEDPAQPAAAAWIRARLPKGVEAPGAFPAGDWLDVIEAAAEIPLARVVQKDKGILPADEQALRTAKGDWRYDLIGLRSPRLLILSPAGSPGRIARCLSLGELVCDALDGLFGVPKGTPTDPLVVYLYESQAEYVKKTRPEEETEKERFRRGARAGHYSAADKISRLFVPAEDDALERVMQVLAHELTHHWVDLRMPVLKGAQRASWTTDTPGYFIEEGFAMTIEGFDFDLRARTWKTIDPRALSLDMTSSASRLFPWKRLLGMSQKEYLDSPAGEGVVVGSRWLLSESYKMDDHRLFYAQSGALCQYLLHADGGKHRHTLLYLIQAFHSGRSISGVVTQHLGMDPEELGAAVVDWAGKASSGVK